MPNEFKGETPELERFKGQTPEASEGKHASHLHLGVVDEFEAVIDEPTPSALPTTISITCGSLDCPERTGGECRGHAAMEHSNVPTPENSIIQALQSQSDETEVQPKFGCLCLPPHNSKAEHDAAQPQESAAAQILFLISEYERGAITRETMGYNIGRRIAAEYTRGRVDEAKTYDQTVGRSYTARAVAAAKREGAREELETVYGWRVNGTVKSVPYARCVIRADAVLDRLQQLTKEPK